MSIDLLHPVLGVIRPWRPEINVEFGQFDTGAVHGLAKVGNDRVDVLVIYAKTQGQGDGGRFITECQRHYATVAVWQIDSFVLRGILARRGFVEITDDDGVTGMIWRSA